MWEAATAGILYFLLTCTKTTIIWLAGLVCKKQRILNHVTSQTAVTIANIDIKSMFVFHPTIDLKFYMAVFLRSLHSISNSLVKLLGVPSCKKTENTFQKVSKSQVLLPLGMHKWGVISLFCSWQPFHLAFITFCVICAQSQCNQSYDDKTNRLWLHIKPKSHFYPCLIYISWGKNKHNFVDVIKLCIFLLVPKNKYVWLEVLFQYQGWSCLFNSHYLDTTVLQCCSWENVSYPTKVLPNAGEARL